MIYDVAGHWLLSEAARDLQPEELEAYADAAEEVLGFVGTSFSGADAAKATRAVVYWINCHLAPDTDARSIKSITKAKGDQRDTIEYADSPSKASDWCRLSRQLAGELIGTGRFPALTSLR